MTWNIHRGVPNDGAAPDLERIANVIRRQSPEVVALQEVRNDDHFPRQPAILKSKLAKDGYRYAYYGVGEESPQREPFPYRNGQLILSKFPILRTQNIPLPTTHAHPPGVPNDSRTSLVGVTLRVPSMGDVRIYSTHLSPPSGKPQVKDQLDQARKILDRDGKGKEVIPRLNEPVLLLGDFNTQPVDTAGRPYSRNSLIRSWIADRGFVDTWTVKRRSDEGATFGNGDPRSSQYRDNRIDYVYASPLFKVLGAHLNLPDRNASDHRAVVVDLRVRGPRLLESGSLLAGDSGKAGWAQLALYKGQRAKLTVCKNQGTDEDNGWAVRARVYDPREDRVYRVEQDGGTSRDMCQTASWYGYSHTDMTLETCLVKRDQVKECRKRAVFDRRS